MKTKNKSLRYASNGIRVIAFTAVSVTLMAAGCNKKHKAPCEAYSFNNPHIKIKNGAVAETAAIPVQKAEIPQ